MKKLIALLMMAVLLMAAGCKKEAAEIQPVYYPDTQIPMVESVSELEYSDVTGTPMYLYKCNAETKKKVLTEYVDYLKNECGFEEIGETEGVTLLAKDQMTIGIASNVEGAFGVFPTQN